MQTATVINTGTLYNAVCAAVSDGVQLIREHGQNEAGVPLYQFKPYYRGNRKNNWVIFDSFTASGIKAVYEALDEKNKRTFIALPLMKAVKVMWKLVK